ncbi:MAG: TonB-dependent receptor [Sedimentisphaerales bacterium]|nr:TonB-dependent receptor [Sedimentisphaerales bacterium]
MDYFDMSIEELLEVSVVTAASRLTQKTTEQSSPVTIITAQDIRNSGLTSIPEILQFFCGVDVLQIDRRKYAIGIHGLHETFSDRTTLLVNGRPADNPVYGGPHFQALPFLVEDIERIEIVRSPASAAWGANALTGVVNIVTKKPSDILGGMAKTTITEFGDSYTHFRWAEKETGLSWKISVGYEDIKSSEDVIDGTTDFESANPALNPLIGFSTFEARDFTRNSRIDTEAFFEITESTKLSAGIGYTHIDAGDYELGGYFPRVNIREDDARTYMKLDHNFENGNTGYLQWAGEFWNMNWPMAGRFSMQRHELEAQYNFSFKEGHNSCVGTSFRWDHINSGIDTAQQVRFDDEPLDEYNVGLFAIDRWELNDQWELESQLRGDYYSGTSTDWSGRLTGFYKPNKASKDIFRFSAAKAFSAPLAELREASMSLLPMGSGLYMLNVTAPESLENEEIFSLETGYTTMLSKTLSLRADAYYQKLDKLIGYKRTTNFLGQIFATADNIDGAYAWGGELELTLDKKWGRISSWYSYNKFEPDTSNQDISAFLPAKHKAGMRYQYRIQPDWTFNANYAYTDTTPGNPATGNNDVNASHRLDFNISKTLNKEKGEIMVGVRDLLDKTLDPVRESNTYAGHEVPGRTFFVSLLLKF